MTGIHIGDIGKLGVRNVQQLRKLQSVRRCLIEHNNELGVCQHRSCRVGLKQVVHILRDARGISAVLSYTLPKGEQEVCTVLVLEQKVDFIDEDEGVLALSSVLCNTVQDRVEDDQHTDGHKLLAEVKDVIADQAVIRVHIGFLGEGVQRAIGNADLLTETNLDDEQRLYVGYVVESSGQMQSYIQTLIDISRAAVGYQLHIESIDLPAFMQHLFGYMESLCRTKMMHHAGHARCWE